jgi:S1-C subfamily serine protease
VIAKAVDENPTRPTYAVAKSANTGGRTGFSISLGTIPTYADSADGMVLDGVRENSPASRAGLKAGDKMVKLAGKDVKNVYDYTAILGEMKPDIEYEVVVVRGGETLTLKITPIKR